MYVSEWPKTPNVVPRPNLGSDSIFQPLPDPCQSWGVLPCPHTITLYLDGRSKGFWVCVKVSFRSSQIEAPLLLGVLFRSFRWCDCLSLFGSVLFVTRLDTLSGHQSFYLKSLLTDSTSITSNVSLSISFNWLIPYLGLWVH